MVMCCCVVTQAFTWFADAMVDHAETFWALFGVDLNAVLEQQPPDTWDTFPIFQMLNNYLRNHGQYTGGPLRFGDDRDSA